MQAPNEIVELVERFSQRIEDYRRTEYKEANVRIQFIDPLFEALGWDVRNVSGYAEQYKDMVHEATLRAGGEARSPDYSFRIGGVRKFFLEAKKPSVDLKVGVGPAYQLRRYAWTAALPLSVLTDSEEFAVYDCRVRPKPDDSASVARIMYVGYEQYADRFDEIHRVFSKESVLQGSFDRYVKDAGLKRGTTAVDVEFLKEIERWRDALARNIALRNPDLSVHELNFAVQRTIDRIIFLRMAEDRGIESYGRLRALGENADIHAQLNLIYREADDKYNAGLFDFQTDTLTPKLSIDDKVLKSILGDLYYPKSPYEFSVLSADVLGQVYEQFLGKVIRLTAGHQAKVEQKPEVKKAGGVYYTPTYIVDYIVHQTVGKLIKGKTPRQIAKLRILDPACGSGSFLLGAYQVLLDYHLHYYGTHDPAKIARGKRPAIYQASGGDWRLTTAEKKRILLNNIHGVDIDRQAVEVTKLSLLLKVLEGETEETLGQQLSLWREPALPDLGDNIKCGNSLIGPDYFEGNLMANDEELRRVNPFDWKDEFSEIMEAGGFDVVIGNPPYVRQEMLDYQKKYFDGNYKVYHGTADLYAYFIERGVSLLKRNGLFSYIVANKWLRANYGRPLRNWMKQQRIEEITDFDALPVFVKATTYPCILRIRRAPAQTVFEASHVKTLNFGSLEEYARNHKFTVNQAALDDGIWSLAGERSQAMLIKLRAMDSAQGKYLDGKLHYGIKTGFNKAFVIDAKTRAELIAEDPGSVDLIKPFLAGRDVKRYISPSSSRYVIFTRRGANIKSYPAIERHLLQFRERLTPKPKGWRGGEWKGRKPGSYLWYEIQDTVDYHAEFEKPKIVVPAIVRSASYALDTEGYYSNDKTSIIVTGDLYLLGLPNSKVIDFVMHSISSTKRGGYFEYKPMYLEQIPIRTIDRSDPDDTARHDKMIALVERMLEVHKKLADASIPTDRELYERQIEATDRRIDELVYELYELTEEEIAIVEAEDR